MPRSDCESIKNNLTKYIKRFIAHTLVCGDKNENEKEKRTISNCKYFI